MTTTINKIGINETMYTEEKIKIQAIKSSEYIRIDQVGNLIITRTDEIPFLISSLQRFLENGEIVEK